MAPVQPIPPHCAQCAAVAPVAGAVVVVGIGVIGVGVATVVVGTAVVVGAGAAPPGDKRAQAKPVECVGLMLGDGVADALGENSLDVGAK